MPYIKIGLLSDFLIPEVSREQQLEFCEILDMFSKEQKYYSQLLSLYKSQKQGLMQKLLAGKVRVKV